MNQTPIIVAVEPITVDMPTACHMLGIGETMMKTLLADGEIVARKIGRRTVFAVEDLKRFASQLPSWEPQS